MRLITKLCEAGNCALAAEQIEFLLNYLMRISCRFSFEILVNLYGRRGCKLLVSWFY
jgi:hypothetical protein